MYRYYKKIDTQEENINKVALIELRFDLDVLDKHAKEFNLLFCKEENKHNKLGITTLKDSDLFILRHILQSNLEHISDGCYISNPSSGYLILTLSPTDKYNKKDIESKLECNVINAYREAVDDDLNKYIFNIHDIVKKYMEEATAKIVENSMSCKNKSKNISGEFIRFFGLEIVDIQIENIELEDGKCIDIILDDNLTKICIQVAVKLNSSLEKLPNMYRCIIMDTLPLPPNSPEGLEAKRIFTTSGKQYVYKKKEEIYVSRLDNNSKASLIFPIIEKDKNFTMQEAITKHTHSAFIAIRDDKRNTKASFEAELRLNLKSDLGLMLGYGNCDIFITGFGANAQEAVDDLDKGYSNILNKLLNYTQLNYTHELKEADEK